MRRGKWGRGRGLWGTGRGFLGWGRREKGYRGRLCKGKSISFPH